ncbi:MAG TPA: potassium channel family protein [Jatrophihabitantaceae bacterium]
MVTIVNFVLVAGLMLAVYWLAPVQDAVTRGWVIRLSSGLALTGAMLAWQVRAIQRVNRPLIRAVHALVSSILMFLIVFALTYLGMSHTQPHSFSQPLNKTGALYFTVTTFATVGYGDITPTTDATRVITTIQMLLDLVVIATTARLLFRTASGTVSRRASGGEGDGPG